MFQSTHPHGVRLVQQFPCLTIRRFQSTHPHGVRRVFSYRHYSTVCFNPRTHTGCDIVKVIPFQSLGRFNPRTHTGCDLCGYFRGVGRVSVSIHAPTRGATIVRGRRACAKWEFQSTHPHGVRRLGVLPPRRITRFNPRTHTGCDAASKEPKADAKAFQSTHPHGVRLDLYRAISFPAFVSIHAPTRGATSRHQLTTFCCTYVSIHAPTRGATTNPNVTPLSYPGFNPRTHTGCDANFARKRAPLFQFQSTHPHGVRLYGKKQSSNVNHCFNPRTHTGCDSVQSYIL